MRPREAIGRDWLGFVDANASTGLGWDVATTEKDTSNPNALAVVQRSGGLYAVRLILRWKTGNDQVALRMVETVLDDLLSIHCRPRALSMDSTSEEFFAQSVRRAFAGRVPTYLISAAEKVSWKGGKPLLYKVVMGNLLCAAAEDNLLALPPEEWIVDDFRLVKRNLGSFSADVGRDGGHGDCFDAVKHGLWALEGIGVAAEASATGLGSRLRKAAGMEEDEEDERFRPAVRGGLAI